MDYRHYYYFNTSSLLFGTFAVVCDIITIGTNLLSHLFEYNIIYSDSHRKMYNITNTDDDGKDDESKMTAVAFPAVYIMYCYRVREIYIIISRLHHSRVQRNV